MQDDPFAQLYRSHRRLEERLTDLERAAADLEGPQHETALAYINDALAWMDRAVARHEDDEERSLFPRLKHRPELAVTLDRLQAEHTQQAALKALLTAALPARDATVRAVAALAQGYRAHLREEEEALFPAAEALLDDEARSALHAEMLSRRGR